MAPLSARDVANELGIPYYAVLEWAAQHGVPRVGPTFVFDESALDAIDRDFADDDSEDELEENDSADDEDDADDALDEDDEDDAG